MKECCTKRHYLAQLVPIDAGTIQVGKQHTCRHDHWTLRMEAVAHVIERHECQVAKELADDMVVGQQEAR